MAVTVPLKTHHRSTTNLHPISSTNDYKLFGVGTITFLFSPEMHLKAPLHMHTVPYGVFNQNFFTHPYQISYG